MQPGIQIPESFRSSQTKSATATGIGGWEGARTSNKGMLLHRGDVCETSRKKRQEKLRNRVPVSDRSFAVCLEDRFLGHGIRDSHVNIASRYSICDTYSIDEMHNFVFSGFESFSCTARISIELVKLNIYDRQ